jgi:hypothetical protein
MAESRRPPFVNTSSVRCTVSFNPKYLQGIGNHRLDESNTINTDYDYTMDGRISFIIYGIPKGQAYH